MPTCLPSNKFLGSSYWPQIRFQNSIKKNHCWKQAFSTATNYMTFMMRYGLRTVPTDRALAGRPPGLPPLLRSLQRARVGGHLCDPSQPARSGEWGVDGCPSQCLSRRSAPRRGGRGGDLFYSSGLLKKIWA